MDRTVSTVSDSVGVVAEELQWDRWNHSGSDLPQRGESVVSVDSAVSFVGGPSSAFLSGADGRADFAGEVAVVVTTPAALAGDVAVRVALPAVAGAAPPADLAVVVTVGVASLVDAGMITVGVTDLADARAASLADAEILFPADPAGVVTVGVTPLVDAGMVTVGVTDLADARAASLAAAGILFPADHAGVVTVGVAPLADAGMALPADLAGVVTMGVAPLTDAGVASLADPDGNDTGGVIDLTVPAPVETVELPLPQGCVVRNCDVIDDQEYGDSEMSCDACVSAGIWCQEMPQIRNDSGCQYVSYVSCVPVFMDYDVPAGGYNCTSETLLSEQLCAVMEMK